MHACSMHLMLFLPSLYKTLSLKGKSFNNLQAFVAFISNTQCISKQNLKGVILAILSRWNRIYSIPPCILSIWRIRQGLVTDRQLVTRAIKYPWFVKYTWLNPGWRLVTMIDLSLTWLGVKYSKSMVKEHQWT